MNNRNENEARKLHDRELENVSGGDFTEPRHSRQPTMPDVSPFVFPTRPFQPLAPNLPMPTIPPLERDKSEKTDG